MLQRKVIFEHCEKSQCAVDGAVDGVGVGAMAVRTTIWSSRGEQIKFPTLRTFRMHVYMCVSLYVCFTPSISLLCMQHNV